MREIIPAMTVLGHGCSCVATAMTHHKDIQFTLASSSPAAAAHLLIWLHVCCWRNIEPLRQTHAYCAPLWRSLEAWQSIFTWSCVARAKGPMNIHYKQLILFTALLHVQCDPCTHRTSSTPSMSFAFSTHSLSSRCSVFCFYPSGCPIYENNTSYSLGK